MNLQEKTVDGLDLTMGTNHFGHFLLTQLLTPLLLSATSEDAVTKPRVVIVSALAHEMAPINWEDINYQREGAIGGYVDSW